jgi:hypothetical protein
VKIRVKLKLHVHSRCASAATGDIGLERDIYLAIAPFPQLIISAKGWETTVESVECMLDEHDQVVCHVESDKTMYHKEEREGFAATQSPEGKRQFEEIIAGYERQGWTREKT